jgi:hypothetical protein
MPRGSVSSQAARRSRMGRICLPLLGAALICGAPLLARAQTAPDAPAAIDPHAAQNPIANVVSIPFQDNTSYDVGPLKRTENVLIVQPVVPFSLGGDWSVVSRWVTPIISAPRVSSAADPRSGLGNLEPQFYFTPTHPGSIIWGIGPEVWMPTASDKTLGVNKWGGGVAAVVLTIQGPILAGVLVNNVWAGSKAPEKVNELTLNPFVFYNFPKGWYVVSAPIMTANWVATGKDQWTVPVGGGFGRVFKVGNRTLNARVQLFDNVQRPSGGGTWASQFQIQFLL